MEQQLLDMAGQIVTFAAPLIAGGALAKIGENSTDTTQQWLGKAWGMLQRRFQGNKKAESALTIFEDEADKPESQERVVQQIVAVFQNDPAALSELRSLVEELRRIQPMPPAPPRSHTQTISGNARVGTAIAGDVTGNVTNIGGGVSGPVMSGTFNQPVTLGPTTTRNVNTGGGDYAEGNIDKSRRTIIGGSTPAEVKPATSGQRTRGQLPATLSADGVHFSYGHALLIGVGEYANQWSSAPTTANDAAQLATLLQDTERAAYPAAQVTLLQNKVRLRRASSAHSMPWPSGSRGYRASHTSQPSSSSLPGTAPTRAAVLRCSRMITRLPMYVARRSRRWRFAPRSKRLPNTARSCWCY